VKDACDREKIRVDVNGRSYEGVRLIRRERPLRQEVQYLALRRADPLAYEVTDVAFMRDMARDLLRELVREVEGGSARRKAV
jgi:hypothetical protein